VKAGGKLWDVLVAGLGLGVAVGVYALERGWRWPR
jgi:hypothetical protein